MNIDTSRPQGAGLIALATTLLLLQACASTPAPTADIAVSTAAVSRAADSGAPTAAPAEMRGAREKLEAANAALAMKDYDLARRMAQRARADAQLAEQKTVTAKAVEAAEQAQRAGQALNEEMARKTR